MMLGVMLVRFAIGFMMSSAEAMNRFMAQSIIAF